MVHERDLGIGAKTLDGDFDAVREARTVYEADPQTKLSMWASTLYSFRYRGACRQELLELVERTILPMFEGADIPELDSGALKAANRADVFAAALFWVSQQTEYSVGMSRRLINAAALVCDYGIERSDGEKLGGHTHALLLLRRNEILLYRVRGATYQAHAKMRVAQNLLIILHYAPHVRDPDQKSRIYRGIGTTYVDALEAPLRGYGYLFKACFIPGIKKNTRTKSIAALVGFRG